MKGMRAWDVCAAPRLLLSIPLQSRSLCECQEENERAEESG